MKSVLEELYAGNIRPTDKVFYKNSKYERLGALVISLQDDFWEMLNDTQKRLFHKLVSTQSDLEYREGMEKFIDGFKLGLRIAIEAMRDDRDLHDLK